MWYAQNVDVFNVTNRFGEKVSFFVIDVQLTCVAGSCLFVVYHHQQTLLRRQCSQFFHVFLDGTSISKSVICYRTIKSLKFGKRKVNIIEAVFFQSLMKIKPIKYFNRKFERKIKCDAFTFRYNWAWNDLISIKRKNFRLKGGTWITSNYK